MRFIEGIIVGISLHIIGLDRICYCVKGLVNYILTLI